MKHLRYLFVFLLLVAILGSPALADTPAPELLPPLAATEIAPDVLIELPPVQPEDELDSRLSREEIIITVLLIAVVVVVSLFSGVMVVALRGAYNAAPPWLAELMRYNLYQGVDQLKKDVERTPNPIDDALEARLRQMLDEAFVKARSVRDTGPGEPSNKFLG